MFTQVQLVQMPAAVLQVVEVAIIRRVVLVTTMDRIVSTDYQSDVNAEAVGEFTAVQFKRTTGMALVA